MKKNNLKPKTPEEIAEMERKRRARMEEEAAKWNVGGEEDFADEGEPVGEGYDEDIDFDDGEEELVDMDDGDDDEDVLDLD